MTTSTYEARAFGIFSAMGIMKAARLAPHSILLPADFESYRHYPAKFKEAVTHIVPVIENVGIDEISIDWSASGRDPRLLASEIKQAVFSATGLSCPIGLAPNKLLAPPRVESQTVFAVEMSISCHMQLADVRVSSKSFRGRYLRRVDLQLFHSEIAF